MRHRVAAVMPVLPAMAAALLIPTAAHAAAPGYRLDLRGVPATFTTAGETRTITAIVSADPGLPCQPVRWSLVVQVAGADLDQAKIQRVQESGGSPLRVRRNGDTVRITDVKFDPKALCGGRTVQAEYVVSFTGQQTGQVAFESQALDARDQPLASATGHSALVAAGARQQGGATAPATTAPATTAPATTEPPATADPSPVAPAVVGGSTASAPPAAALPAAGPKPGQKVSASSIPSLLGPGLAVGAVLVLLGVGLLIKMRRRSRGEKLQAARRQQMTMPYYPAR